MNKAFCRQQRQIAHSGTPKWHQHIRKRKLEAFWQKMEQRTHVAESL